MERKRPEFSYESKCLVVWGHSATLSQVLSPGWILDVTHCCVYTVQQDSTYPDETVKAWPSQDRWNSSGINDWQQLVHIYPTHWKLSQTPNGNSSPDDQLISGSYSWLQNASPGFNCETSQRARLQKGLATWNRKRIRGEHCWSDMRPDGCATEPLWKFVACSFKYFTMGRRIFEGGRCGGFESTRGRLCCWCSWPNWDQLGTGSSESCSTHQTSPSWQTIQNRAPR